VALGSFIALQAQSKAAQALLLDFIYCPSFIWFHLIRPPRWTFLHFWKFTLLCVYWL